MPHGKNLAGHYGPPLESSHGLALPGCKSPRQGLYMQPVLGKSWDPIKHAPSLAEREKRKMVGGAHLTFLQAGRLCYDERR